MPGTPDWDKAEQLNVGRRKRHSRVMKNYHLLFRDKMPVHFLFTITYILTNVSSYFSR